MFDVYDGSIPRCDIRGRRNGRSGNPKEVMTAWTSLVCTAFELLRGRVFSDVV